MGYVYLVHIPDLGNQGNNPLDRCPCQGHNTCSVDRDME